MSTLQSEIFEAFRSIGVPEDKALKAAEIFSKKDEGSIKEIEDRFNKIGHRLDGMQADIAGLKSDVAVLKWMLGFVLALQLGIFVKLFFR